MPATATAEVSPPDVGQQPEWADDGTLAMVRPKVREILLSSPAYAQLPAEERRRLAREMVKVSAYMANPEGLATEELARGAESPRAVLAAPAGDEAPLAEAQSSATERTRERLSEAPGFAGADFEGGAIRQGTEEFGNLVQTVDFPKFVAGLIEGVFAAIVDSSIQQMQAYGELLANVAKTVDQFAQDNITANSARDWLTERFPDSLSQSMGGDEWMSGFAEDGETPEPAPRVVVTAENPEESLALISSEIGLAQPITDISSPESEAELVRQARLQIARGRQQLLASMVILGINRIVVTDGLINAKVVFSLRASDRARRTSNAAMHDSTSSVTRAGVRAKYGGWFSPFSASAYADTQNEHVATVSSSVDEDSESKAELKANLSGEVRVAFKSDYFPMERLANPEMIAAIQGRAAPPEKRLEGA